MPPISDQAVVLTRLEYSETSQIIVMFTRTHGKVRAIAKGIKRGTKKRFATGMDALDIGEVVVTSRDERGAGLATLTEWKQTVPLAGLREKLFRIYGGLYAADLLARLTEDWDPHLGLFDRMVAMLVDLAGATEALPSVVQFQRSLLDAIGSIPRFDACVLCSRALDLTHFSSFEGGLICRHCEPNQVEKRELSATTVQALSSGAAAPNLLGVFDILDYHLSHLMGRESPLAEKLVSAANRRKMT